MKSRMKSILALTGTLVLGMVLGGLIASQVLRAHIHKFRELREKKNFTTRIIEVTNANTEQQLAMQPILENFGQEIEAMHMRHFEEVRSSHKAMRDSLSAHLDPEQIASLDKEFRRMTGRVHRMMKDSGNHMHKRHRNNMRRGE